MCLSVSWQDRPSNGDSDKVIQVSMVPAVAGARAGDSKG